MLIIYQGEVDSLTDRRSPMTNTHINVMVKVTKIKFNLVFKVQVIKLLFIIN